MALVRHRRRRADALDQVGPRNLVRSAAGKGDQRTLASVVERNKKKLAAVASAYKTTEAMTDCHKRGKSCG
jgi:hypothetical protein